MPKNVLRMFSFTNILQSELQLCRLRELLTQRRPSAGRNRCFNTQPQSILIIEAGSARIYPGGGARVSKKRVQMQEDQMP